MYDMPHIGKGVKHKKVRDKEWKNPRVEMKAVCHSFSMISIDRTCTRNTVVCPSCAGPDTIPGGANTPRHGTNDKPPSAAAPSWARGNPYVKHFPRARVWTRKQRLGLSGNQPPSGWDAEAELEEAKRTDTRKEISAKDLYHQLVSATNLERMSTTVSENPSSPANLPTKGLPQILHGTEIS